MTRRYVVGQISHETNAFSPIRTGMRHFAERGCTEGREVLERFQGTRTPIGGFIDFAAETGAELVPTVSASATPSGLVAAEAYAELLAQLLDGIQAAGRVDGVLLALHGAMVVEGTPDAEGDMLAWVRQLVGPRVPVAVTLDYHANVTEDGGGSGRAFRL